MPAIFAAILEVIFGAIMAKIRYQIASLLS